METWQQPEMVPDSQPDWSESLPSLSEEISCPVEDKIAQRKWGLYGTYLNEGGVIILQPLHCAINI